MSSTSLSSPAVGTFTPEAFAAHLAAQPAHAPAWWLERKRAAHARFAELPMPGPTDEGWRFSSRETLTLAGFVPSTASAATGAAVPLLLSVEQATAALTFCDGRLVSRQALPADLAARGVVVGTLQEALRSHPELLREHFLSQPQKLGSEKFVPKGVEVRDPIVVTHASSGAGTAVFPHTLVILEEQARAIVVDAFLSPDAPTPVGARAGAFACGANDLYAGHGAQLTYVAAQRWSLDTLSFQLNSTVVRRDARVQSLNLHLGGRQARHESLSQLQAPGAFSEMLAVTVAGDTQEFDQRTLQIHQAPHTKSDLLYKNALLDRARTTFSGLIVVDPDAQKTDAYQSNRNLMLSDDAEANSLPGLEIQANDVRCTHGATSSRIDPQQLFYLEARGISPAKARELLVFGFFEEVLDRLEHEGLHESLRQLIATRFH
jgi:Fe-S cluster assembly protein SufD